MVDSIKSLKTEILPTERSDFLKQIIFSSHLISYFIYVKYSYRSQNAVLSEDTVYLSALSVKALTRSAEANRLKCQKNFNKS